MKQKTIITEDYYGGEKGFDSLLNNYYEDGIKKIPRKDQEKVRKFVEEGLIINERRVGVNEEAVKSSYEISEDTLNLLLESRIIKIENTHLGKAFEVSHDAMINPILKSKEKRVNQEREKARLIAAKKRFNIILRIILFLASITVLFLVYYSNLIRKNAQITELTNKRIQDSLDNQNQVFRILNERLLETARNNYNLKILEAKGYSAAENFGDVIQVSKDAISIIDRYAINVGDSTAKNRIDNYGETAFLFIKNATQKGGLQEQFEEQLGNCTKLLGLEDSKLYVDVNNCYQELKKLGYYKENKRAQELIQSKETEINRLLDIAFKNFKDKGDEYLRGTHKESFEFALENYQEAIRIQPRNTYILQKIEECKAKINGN